ncbi:27112_t:CDS:2, partial [Gigaspora margarita]
VIIAVNEFKIQKKFKKLLEKAINEMKKPPNILEKAINDVKNLAEISQHQEIKKYFQDQQLKDFDKKVLKIENMINLLFNILSSLADLKTGIFLFNEKVNNLYLEGTFSNEIDLLVDEIDKLLKPLSEWNNCCTNFTNHFEDFNNFVKNIEDSSFFFKIQKKLLTELDKTRKHLCNKLDKIEEYSATMYDVFRFKSPDKKIAEEKEKAYLDLLFIIGLKSVYDLFVELEYAGKRLKLLDSNSNQKISDFLKKLNYTLKQTKDSVEVFKKSELYLKDYSISYAVENLSQLA